MAEIIQARMFQKVQTFAEWEANDLVLGQGEMALVTTPSGIPLNMRWGDGTKRFSQLPNVIAYDQGQFVAITGTVLPTVTGVGYTILGGGTYTQSVGGDVVIPDGKLGVLVSSGDTWALSSTVDLPIQEGVDVIDPIGDRLPKESAVAKYAVSKDVLGITTFSKGDNIFPFLSASKFNESYFWDTGFLLADGRKMENAAWRISKGFLNILPGEYKCNIGLIGSVSICIYDSEKNVIRSYANVGAYSGRVDWELSVPEEGKYIRLSRYTQSGAATADYYLKPASDLGEIIDSKYFLNVDNISSEFDKRGFKSVEAGTNAAAQLTGSDINSDIWNIGFLHYNGSINTSETAYRYSNPIPVNATSYRLSASFRGNSRLWILDGDGSITRQLDNTTESSTLESIITFLDNEKYIQFSQIYSSDTSHTFLIQIEDYNKIEGLDVQIKLDDIVKESSSDRAPSGAAVSEAILSSFAKSKKTREKFPIISFISDDGHVANWEWYIPLLDSKGVKSTFAIITGRMGVNQNYATAAQVRSLYDNGHDVAGHTETHRHTADLAIEEQINEIKNNKIKLMQIVGRDNCNVFVAPFSSRNVDTDRVIRGYFDCDFISVPIGTIASGTCCNEPPVDSYMLKRVNFDAVSLPQNEHLELMKRAVDVCSDRGEWLAFCIHPQYPEYSEVDNPDGWSRRRQDLSDLIDYIKSKDIPIATASDALYLCGNIVEIGNKRLDDKYFIVGMDGSSEGVFF